MKNLLLAAVVSVAGCDGLHHVIYNMSPCEITVIYSEANIHNNLVVLSPGENAESIGGLFPAALDNLVVKDRGIEYVYSAQKLAEMRSSGQERWGYFSDGLHFMFTEPNTNGVTAMANQCH